MLVIRLQRTGRHNLAAYRVVVAEKSKAVKKEAIEVVGHYLPTQTPKVVEINVEKIQEWINKGAQPSETVASLLKNNGVPGMEKYIGKPNKTGTRKKAVPEEPAPKAEVAAEEAVESPIEAPEEVAETPVETETPEAAVEAPAEEATPEVETPAETETPESTETPAEEPAA